MQLDARLLAHGGELIGARPHEEDVARLQFGPLLEAHRMTAPNPTDHVELRFARLRQLLDPLSDQRRAVEDLHLREVVGELELAALFLAAAAAVGQEEAADEHHEKRAGGR